jgi:hypothetical protein
MENIGRKEEVILLMLLLFEKPLETARFRWDNNLIDFLKIM